MRSLLNAVVAAVVASAIVVSTARAQAPLEDTPIPMWVPEGQVTGAVKVGNTLVVGGSFNYVGPPTGPFAIADGANATNFNTAAGLTGIVTEVVSDGASGWFAVEGVPGSSDSGKLVHVAADGRRDAGFAPPANLVAVYHLAMDGGRLFVAGFTGTGGVTIFALDPATGGRLPWAPATAPTRFVTNLVASQGVLYVAIEGAAFGESSGLALDAMTGAVVPFPALATGEVAAAIDDRVYVVTKTDTSHTLQAYTRSGALVPAFTAPPYYRVHRVVVSASRVYAIVQDTAPSTSPTRVAALDAPTGTAVWSSSTFEYGDGGPADLAREGNTLFVGGGFTRVGGAPRTHLASFDATTGALLPWAPSVGSFVASVAAVNGSVALGGYFQSVGGIAKRHLVSLDLATGRPTPVQPPDSNASYITALAASGDLVVAATGFSFLLSTAGEIFAYSAATGTRYPKVLQVGGGDAFSLDIHGGTLFIGGSFQTIDGQARRHLAAYDLVAGQVLPWNPSPNQYVDAMKVSAPSLYVVGRFTALSGAGRKGAAAFDLGSLQMTAWDPNIANEKTASVDVWQDRVFLGMHVSTDRTFPVPRTILRTLAVDRVVGAPLNVDLPIGPIMAQVGGTLAVFTFYGPSSLPPPVTFDGSTGQPIAWNPSVVRWSSSQGLGLIGLDGYLVLTGSISVGGRPISNLAVFKPRIVFPGAPRQIQMTVSGSTVSLAWTPGAAPAPLGYVIEAGSAPGLSDLGRFPLGGATQVAADVAPGSYALRVRAIAASGEGPASSEWRVTTPATPTVPGAPSGLVTAVAGNVVYLAWTAGAGNATTYVVEGGSAPGLSNLGVIAIGSLDTAAAGAVPPGTYYLRVRAANAVGPSAPSNEVVVVVP